MKDLSSQKPETQVVTKTWAISLQNSSRTFQIYSRSGSTLTDTGFQEVAGTGGFVSHFVRANPALPYVYVFDSPAGNGAYVYKIDPKTGKPTAITGSPFAISGGGAEMVTFHPSGKWAYYPDTGKVSGLSIDLQTGAVSQHSGVANTMTCGGYQNAISPNGKFFYQSCYSPPIIYAYEVNQTDGTLSEVAGSPFNHQVGGIHGITIDPSGKFLAAGAWTGGGNGVRVYSIGNDGVITQTKILSWPSLAGMNSFTIGSKTFISAGVVPDQIRIAELNLSTGDATELAGSPFSLPGTPVGPNQVRYFMKIPDTNTYMVGHQSDSYYYQGSIGSDGSIPSFTAISSGVTNASASFEFFTTTYSAD